MFLCSDCCDGSDEYNGKVKCLDTCWEAGKVARQRLEKKITTYQAGISLRKIEVEKAKKSFQEDEAEVLKLKAEAKVLKGIVEQLKGVFIFLCCMNWWNSYSNREEVN